MKNNSAGHALVHSVTKLFHDSDHVHAVVESFAKLDSDDFDGDFAHWNNCQHLTYAVNVQVQIINLRIACGREKLVKIA